MISGPKKSPEPANALEPELNPPLKGSISQENAAPGEIELPVEACCGNQLSTTETDCCGYHTTDVGNFPFYCKDKYNIYLYSKTLQKDIEKSLNVIVNLTREGDILSQIYSLMDDVSISTQKVVHNLTFAVFIPGKRKFPM